MHISIRKLHLNYTLLSHIYIYICIFVFVYVYMYIQISYILTEESQDLEAAASEAFEEAEAELHSEHVWGACQLGVPF